MNKNNEGFLDGSLDPAVQAALGSGNQRRNERAMPKKARANLKKSQAKQEARNGSRAVYDLDPELINAIKKIADELCTPASQVAGIALHVFLEVLAREDVDLNEYKVPLDRNPRYEYKLVWHDS